MAEPMHVYIKCQPEVDAGKVAINRTCCVYHYVDVYVFVIVNYLFIFILFYSLVNIHKIYQVTFNIYYKINAKTDYI